MLILVASSHKLLNSRLSTWGWPSGLEHNSRIQGFHSIQAISCTSYYAIRCQRFFFLQVVSRKKGKNWVPTSYLQEEYKIRRWVFFVLRVAQVKKAKDILPTSYIQGQVQESQGSCWVRQGRSIATRRGHEKVKKRKRPRKARRWLQRRQGSVCPKPRLPFFWFTSVWV